MKCDKLDLWQLWTCMGTCMTSLLPVAGGDTASLSQNDYYYVIIMTSNI